MESYPVPTPSPKILIDQALGNTIQIGVCWEFLGGKKVDLDATVMVVNEMGHTIDAVYYNKLESDDKAIQHSGDSKDGVKEGYDEVITIDLNKLHYSISYLAILINSFNGNGFTEVETATVSIF